LRATAGVIQAIEMKEKYLGRRTDWPKPAGTACRCRADFARAVKRALTMNAELAVQGHRQPHRARTMRVTAPNAAGFVGAAPAARRNGSGTFAVSGPDAPRAAAAANAPRAVAGIDALLALQALDGPTDRRRRAARRGRMVLDALEEMKLGLLAGSLDGGALRKLRSAVAILAEGSGDTRLDGVLAEIELRAAVELAKFAGVRGLGDRP
jgi:hypothetical protein